MIYTLTLSPSSDLLIKSEDFSLETVNRYQDSKLLPGGKGINASLILKRHNFDNIAFSLFDQHTFNSFQDLFKHESLEIININHPNLTRINIKYYGAKDSFELNGPRTILTSEIKAKVLDQIAKLTSQDMLMIMGLSDDAFLKEILEILKQNKVNFVLDIDSPNLKEFLSFHPYLIKPNLDELKRNFKFEINHEQDLLSAMKQLQTYGAQNIIVSMDKDGSYALTKDGQILKASIIKPIKVFSATGAGDSMIALFCAKYLETRDAANSLLFASAGAMGTVASEHVGTLEQTKKYLSHVKVEVLN